MLIKWIAKRIENVDFRIPAFISLFLLYLVYFQISKWSQEGTIPNIKMYVLSLVFFWAVMTIIVIIMALLQNKRIMSLALQDNISKWIGLIVLCFGGWLLFQCFKNEVDPASIPGNYYRHLIPGILYAIILILFSSSILLLIKTTHGSNNSRFRILFAVLLALVQGWFLYTADPFLDNGGGIFHIDAYTNSIINAVSLAPYEMYSNSIYGHYGLFFIIPVRLIHSIGFSYWTGVALTIAVFGFITFFTEYWCISQVVKNDVIYMISVVAFAIVSFQMHTGQYYQVLPHRFMVQPLILAGSIVSFRGSNNKSGNVARMLMPLLCISSMLWNLETGLVVSIVWTVSSIYIRAKKEGKYSISNILLNIVLLVVEFFAGYFIVNIYNLFVGGNLIDLITYIYPVASNTYPIGALQLPLMSPNNGYFLVILVLLAGVSVYLKDALLLSLDEPRFATFIAGIMGIGVITYYMNRAANPATITSCTFIIVTAHMCDISIHHLMETVSLGSARFTEFKKLWNTSSFEVSASILTIVLLCGLALASISTFGGTITNKLNTTWNTQELDKFIEEMNQVIPEDAVAYGEYTAQLFALMNRTTGIYISDWQDAGPIPRAKLEEILKASNFEHNVVSIGRHEHLPKNYWLKLEFKYTDKTFYLYERID